VASVVNSVLSPREETYLRFDFERATVEVTHLYGYGDDDWRVTPAPGCHDEVLKAWGTRSTGRAAGTPPSSRTCLARSAPGAVRRSARPRPAARWPWSRDLRLGFHGRPVTPAQLAPGTPFYGQMNGGIPA